MSFVIRDAYRSKDVNKIDTVLQFINSDLKSKLSIPAKNAFPDGHGRDCPPMCDPGRPNNVNTGKYFTVQVTVKVIGKKSGKSLIGYSVFAKPQYSLNISLIDTFNPTDKATLGILPGMKLIWIESGNKTIEQRPVNVSSANPKMEVDFYVE